MSRTNRRNEKLPSKKHKKRAKDKHKPVKRNKPRADKAPLHDHVQDPPQPSESEPATDQNEFHGPTEPFTLAPCKICGISKCGITSVGHESPVVVAISSKGTSPAACGIFCNVNSSQNEAFLIHGNDLNRREIHIRTAIAALEQIEAYLGTKAYKDSPETERITQVIIKTSSKWLVK
jgi:hypothetical protein